jgi:hypothetical protein
MNRSAASRRWFGAWRTVVRVPQDDPADLGTAFGLDLSLSELADDPPAPPPSPREARTGWMQGLVSRRKPAF